MVINAMLQMYSRFINVSSRLPLETMETLMYTLPPIVKHVLNFYVATIQGWRLLHVST